MGGHRALGATGGARCVEDGGVIIGEDVNGGECSSFVDQVLPQVHTGKYCGGPHRQHLDAEALARGQ